MRLAWHGLAWRCGAWAQGGISLFLTLARDDRAAERDASIASAALRLRLAGLTLGEMALLRSQGVASWKKAFETVSLACRGAADLEGGVPICAGPLCQHPGDDLQAGCLSGAIRFCGLLVKHVPATGHAASAHAALTALH